MSKRKPFFLLGALAIPVGFLLLFLIGSLSSIFLPDHRGGNIGGNASAPEYIQFFGIVGGVILFGIILAIISSVREERYLGLGVGFWAICVIPAVVLIINIVAPIVKHIVYP